MRDKLSTVEKVDVFCVGAQGGNPSPVVLDAGNLSPEDMRSIAAACGREAGFVLPPTDARKADLRYRFFVPLAEMDMCGHATLGTTWLLASKGKLKPGEVRIETKCGIGRARISDTGAVAYPNRLVKLPCSMLTGEPRSLTYSASPNATCSICRC